MIWLLFMVSMDASGDITSVHTEHWKQSSTLDQCNDRVFEIFKSSDTNEKSLRITKKGAYEATITFPDMDKQKWLCSSGWSNEAAQLEWKEIIDKQLEEFNTNKK